MESGIQRDCSFTVETDDGDAFKRYFQDILNEYHASAHPSMQVPESKRFLIRVTDETGETVGGALIWVYWGWLDVSVLALEPHVRGRGVGRQLMHVIEDKAREEGCARLRVEAFEEEAGFYQNLGYRIVGCPEDYPEGFAYYWMRKDLLAG
jgi:GNAT superfamily N-acetyltransferase